MTKKRDLKLMVAIGNYRIYKETRINRDKDPVDYFVLAVRDYDFLNNEVWEQESICEHSNTLLDELLRFMLKNDMTIEDEG